MNPPPLGAPSDPQAAAARAKETDKVIKFALAEGAVALAALRLQRPDLADPLIHKVTGIDLRKPGAAKVTPLAALWLLPQPFGAVPPTYYGLPPNYLGQIAPVLPESELLATMSPDHPSVIAHQQKLAQQRALTLTPLARDASVTVEVAQALQRNDLGSKVEALQRIPDNLNAWFHRQLTGPHDEALKIGVTATDLLAGSLPQPAPAVPIDAKLVHVVVELQALLMQALQAANGFDP